MPRIILSILAMLLLGLLLLSQTGCLIAAAAAGTGATVAYVKGNLQTSLQAKPKAIADAAVAALKSLDVAVISQESTALDAKVVGRTARDVKVTIDIEQQTGDSSKVSIRAGVFGDDALQGNILNEIKKQLGIE